MTYSELFNQGIECYRNNSFKEALSYLKEANNLWEFETCEENYCFGVSFYKNKDFKNSLEYLIKANEIKEFDTCDENYYLGVSFHKNLDFNNALKYLTKANKIQKFDRKWQYFFYGIALFKNSYYKESLCYLEKFHELSKPLEKEYNVAVAYYENSCYLAFKKSFPYNQLILKKNKSVDEILYSMIYEIKYGKDLITIKAFNSTANKDDTVLFLQKLNNFLESEIIEKIKTDTHFASELRNLINQLHSKRLLSELTRKKINDFIINDKEFTILNKALLLEIFKFDEKDLTWFYFLKKEVVHCSKINDFESIIDVYGFVRARLYSDNYKFKRNVAFLSHITKIMRTIKSFPFISQKYNIDECFKNLENIKNLTFVVDNLRAVGHNAHLTVLCYISNSIKRHHPQININLIITNENSVENIYDNPAPTRNMAGRTEEEQLIAKKLTAKELTDGHYDDIKKFLKVNNAEYLNIYICDRSQDKSIIEQYFRYIKETKSDALIFLGGMFRSYIIQRLSFNVLPIIVLPAQVTNAIDDFNDFTIAINDDHLKKLKSTLKNPENTEILMIPFCDTKNLNEESNSKVLKRNSFTIITALSGPIIADSIASYDEKDMELLYNYIKSNKINWLIVGVPNANTVLSASKFMKMMHSEKMVELKPFTLNLEEIIAQSDIVMLPPRITGGGTAISLGVKNRRPILIPDISDGAGTVSEESTYSNDMESLIEKLDLFLYDKEYLKNATDKTFEVFSKRSGSSLASLWVDTLNKVHEKFHKKNK